MKFLKSNTQLKIGYDPIYGFNKGFHGLLKSQTDGLFDWREIELSNYYEEAVWSEKSINRRELVNIGLCKDIKDVDIVMTPHMLLDQGVHYFTDIEEFGWLFGDDYESQSEDNVIPTWKIREVARLLVSDDLRVVLWWSQSALDRFLNHYCQMYPELYKISEIVSSKSIVLRPFQGSNLLGRTPKVGKTVSFMHNAQSKHFFRKGTDIVLRTFNRLKLEGITNWTLDIYGGIPTSSKSLLCEGINVIDYIDREKFFVKMSETDVLLFTSRADTYGLVLEEAKSAGMYILATVGDHLIASAEILADYPNMEILKSSESDGTYSYVDSETLYKKVKQLLETPLSLESYDSEKFNLDKFVHAIDS